MKRSLILLLLLFTPLYSHGEATVFQMIEEMRDDVERIVHRYDKEALIFFHIKPKIENSKLLGTPYSLNQVIINDSLGMPMVQEFNVRVISKDENLQSRIEPILVEFFSPYGGSLNLVVRKDSVAEREVASLKSPGNFETTWYMAAGAGVLFLLTLILLLKKFKGKSENLKHTIEESAQKIASALEAQRSRDISETNANNMQSAINPNQQNDSISERAVLELSEASALELLMDCYWGRQDSYAIYIWKRLSPNVKGALIRESKLLADYVKYVSSQNESFAEHHLNPYYLSPVKLHHISNEDLSKFVKSNLSSLLVLPPLRSNGISLTPAERVKASHEKLPSDSSSLIEQLQGLPKSKERTLPSSVRLVITSVADEEGLLDLDNVTIDMKKSAPSIVWSKDLSDESLSEILEVFSANELAEIWVGPERVLERIRGLLSEKKYGLVQSYLEKEIPSRRTSQMFRFHSAVLEKLQEQVDGEKDAA